MLVGHPEDLLATHLADQVRMLRPDMLLDLGDELVVALSLDVEPAFAVDDLHGHLAPSNGAQS